jgi:ABC-type antimicrobial peptide transport system permease subunit
LTGLLLAAVGLFAVASYDAATRDYEMGVRLALGATPGALKRLILRDACTPVAIGTLAGLAAAWWASGGAQAFLFQTDSGEPAYYVIVAGVLVATAAIAAWVPASRAARTNPVVLLKAQ